MELSQEETFMPPQNFWTASRYSPKARLASVMKIKLLTGHSWLATGMVRRHMDGPALSPLCCSAIETVEHLLFECPELALITGHWQSWYRIELDRQNSAESIKANK